MLLATLFADGGNEVAAGASVVACFLAAITGLFSWLSTRDKLRFDANVVKMEAQISALQRETLECHKDREEDKAEIATLRAEVNGLRQRVNDQSAMHRPMNGA